MRHMLVLFLLLGCSSSDEGDVADGGRLDSGINVDAGSTSRTIYLNFGGQLVKPGTADDVAQNKSRLISAEVTMAAFDASLFANTAAQDVFVAGIVERVTELYAPFDVNIVTERPASGTYAMAIIGGNPEDVGLPACTEQDLSCSLGTAWLDCAPFPHTEPGELVYNVDGDGAIVFVFSEVFARFPERSFEESVDRIGVTTAHELAHSFGLAHVADETCVMNGDSTGLTTGFCVAAYTQFDGHCGPGTVQDAPAILQQVFAAE